MAIYRLFHGAKCKFDEFIASETGAQGPGVYLADTAESAQMYGDILMELELELHNPFYFYPTEDSFDAEANPELLEQVLDKTELAQVLNRMDEVGMSGYGYEVQKKLRERGHDAIIMVCPWGTPVLDGVSGQAVVIAFDPSAIKILNHIERKTLQRRP